MAVPAAMALSRVRPGPDGQPHTRSCGHAVRLNQLQTLTGKKVDLHLPHSVGCLNIMRFGEAPTCRDFTFICLLPIRVFQMILAATSAILPPHLQNNRYI